MPKAKTPLDSAANGLEFFSKLQMPTGHWACEYGGPMFLLPGVVITWYVTNTPIPPEYAVEIKRYLSDSLELSTSSFRLLGDVDSRAFKFSDCPIVLRGISLPSCHFVKGPMFPIIEVMIPSIVEA